MNEQYQEIYRLIERGQMQEAFARYQALQYGYAIPTQAQSDSMWRDLYEIRDAKKQVNNERPA